MEYRISGRRRLGCKGCVLSPPPRTDVGCLPPPPHNRLRFFLALLALLAPTLDSTGLALFKVGDPLSSFAVPSALPAVTEELIRLLVFSTLI